ncbi:cell division protein FtsK [Lactobacillus bombicola]|uniref:Cell division protein FtsK n=1 Tax=Lactobacillus bombicola TaxID=1505723 RepID=A0ABX9LTN7_9LACO|nr:cell division protein FtsK [Lactobacillus bombicola]RHW50332.1 cell division protein FtsK [Lactobacillus bombicola]
MRTTIDLDGNVLSLRGSTGTIIVGKPGSGKSVLTTYLLLEILKLGGFALVCDTKRSDFYSLKDYLINGNERVASSPSQVAKILRQLSDLMTNRYETHMGNWGMDWVDYNLRPVVLIFDEFSATIAEADKKTEAEIDKYLKQIIFKSRQMGGIYTILASQRLTADVLGRNVTSEFSTRIGMNYLDSISQSLAFPGCDTSEMPIIPNIPGYGLIYDDHFSNLGIPQPFIAPDISQVTIPEIVKKLDSRYYVNNFAKEDYWQW